MILLQLAGLILFLVLIPFCMGLLPVSYMQKENKNISTIMISGYLIMLALFEAAAIPTILYTTHHGFTILTRLYTALSLVIALAGIICVWYGRKKGTQGQFSLPEGMKLMDWEGRILWILFAGLIAFQFYMAFTRASFDGDDAYYVAHSLAAQQSDTMYRINPYLGRSTSLDVRHALAAFPIWIAYVGRMSGIHATIISHSVIPVIALSMTYMLYYRIGSRLLCSKRDMLPVFMIIIGLLQMFGNVSIYTNETFLMTRSWQGKSLAANFVFPGIVWIFLTLFGREQEKKPDSQERSLWVLLSLVSCTAGLSSSLAVFLCVVMTGILAFFMMVRRRKLSILIKAGLCCIPGGVYMLLYLFLRV